MTVSNRKGLTLIETLIVIPMITILISTSGCGSDDKPTDGVLNQYGGTKTKGADSKTTKIELVIVNPTDNQSFKAIEPIKCIFQIVLIDGDTLPSFCYFGVYRMKGKVKQLEGSIVPEPKKLTNRKYECTVDIKKFIPNLKGEFFIEIDCHDSVHDPKKAETTDVIVSNRKVRFVVK